MTIWRDTFNSMNRYLLIFSSVPGYFLSKMLCYIGSYVLYKEFYIEASLLPSRAYNKLEAKMMHKKTKFYYKK